MWEVGKKHEIIQPLDKKKRKPLMLNIKFDV